MWNIVSILRSFIPTGLSKAVIRVPSAPGATHFLVQDSSSPYSIQRILLFSKCIAPLIGFNSPWIEIHGYTGSNRMNSVGCCFWCIAIIVGMVECSPPIKNTTEKASQPSAVSSQRFFLSTVHFRLSTFFPFCLLAFIHYNLLVTFTVFPRFNK